MNRNREVEEIPKPGLSSDMKDTKAAKKTWDDLIKAYPDSDAAAAAKERIARLK